MVDLDSATVLEPPCRITEIAVLWHLRGPFWCCHSAGDAAMTLGSRLMAAVMQLPPASTREIVVDRNLPVEMADGSVLLADRWWSRDSSVADRPVVLLRTPYGRRRLGMMGRLFAERGYQLVIQSCRGTFGSGGSWLPFRNEHADGRDTLDWLERQPWYDGRLATFGPSYLGLTQFAVARDAPESLRAMVLSETSSNFRDAVIFPSGGFALEGALTWIYQREVEDRPLLRRLQARLVGRRRLQAAFDVLPLADADVAAVGRTIPYYQDWLDHENRGDPWWNPVDFGPDVAGVPPSSLVGGWYDFFLPSQLEDYRAMRGAGQRTSLTIGPWTHGSPGAIAASLRDGLAWFDRTFDTSGSPERQSVSIFLMGDRRWVKLPHWPPPAQSERWFLHPGRALARSQPPASGPDHYRYNPADPTPAIGGPSINPRHAGRRDQRRRETRPDVLTYTSPALSQKLIVVGPIVADLHVRSSLEYSDFFVHLCDVSPKGRSIMISGGMVRLRPGDGIRGSDGSLSVQVSLMPTANTFQVGHQLRVQVSSGAHPLIMRNTGTSEPLKTATELRVADQEVFHDPEHSTSIVLPVR